MTTALKELRVLEGPNLYFPRAAIKLTVDVEVLGSMPVQETRRFAERIGLRSARPGEPGSGFRQRFVARAVARLVRQIARESGTTRLAVRVRPTAEVHTIVVAFPWRRRGRATALGEAAVQVLDALPADDLDAVVTSAAGQVSAAEPGDRPSTIRPRIPVVAITGTNGKTTTARMVAHIARTSGLCVGWSSTDGIYIDGELVEAGDYSGPGGVGQVLARSQVELAVAETARGGILLRGVGVTHNDVSVVTNVTADHLGLQGIDTVDQLAEVKAVVPQMTRKGGWAVLNGDDPRTHAMRSGLQAQVWLFSRDEASPSLRDAIDAGGRATTVIDGQIAVLESGLDPIPVVEVADVPMTLCGLSAFNVENALAAASAALALGLSADVVAKGLREFAPGPELNPGRMNIYSLGEVTVVVDLAHNVAGLHALLEIMTAVRAAEGSIRLAVGTAGDRTDDILLSLAELAARDADEVCFVIKDRYLRGRSPEATFALYREGAAHVGVEGAAELGSELEGLQHLVSHAEPGDVVAVMAHQDSAAIAGWLRARGATVDTPPTLRRKVEAARG